MDILNEITSLLCQDASGLESREAEYVKLCHLEANLFEQIAEALGQESVDKLIDIQVEREQVDKLRCFLYGLRLGVETLRL